MLPNDNLSTLIAEDHELWQYNVLEANSAKTRFIRVPVNIQPAVANAERLVV